MKFNKLLLILFSIYLLSSCDVIDQPFEESIIIDTNVTDNIYKKILLEDYTGFNCPNCPKAALVIHDILKTYSNNVIPISVHSGYFATPKTSASSPYKYDFRTSVGEDWDKYFGNSVAGNPNGMINRTNSHKIYSYQEWLAQISQNLQKLSDFKIKINTNFNEDDKIINSEIEITTLNNLTNKYKLNVILIQDSIIEYQNDNGNNVADYIHNHVLRASFNGSWGDEIINSAIAKNTKISKQYSLAIKQDDKHPWLKEHLKVIAFIYNAETYEIMQVEEVSIN